jgi:hypothetical protein
MLWPGGNLRRGRDFHNLGVRASLRSVPDLQR